MQMPTPPGERSPLPTRPLRARIEYERDGTILFALDGHESRRFERVLAALRDAIPVAEREWWPDLGLWVLDAGWDEELLEILEEHFERGDILVRGQPLDAWEDEEVRDDDRSRPRRRTAGRHGWIDLEDRPHIARETPRLGRLILPYWGDRHGQD